ncbi:MAG TPA: iron-containing alcohol dehydrogenase [Planctomycetota bacterium]|nr:iron-containing alcohol dehydrogenase [Planctomycetota bacterium]
MPEKVSRPPVLERQDVYSQAGSLRYDQEGLIRVPNISDHSSSAPAIPGGFNFQPHTRLIYGEGTLEQLGERVKEYGGKRVLLVTDGGIVKAGHATRAQEILARAGLKTILFDRVQENPTTKNVAEAVAAARSGDIDFIIGLGGGSSMDTAKGANFIYTNGGKMADYWGVNKASKAMLPLIAIPTTAGTGSECQSFALIADEETHQKMACGDDKAYARVAILDPLLTLSMPRGVTANTGIDTIAHALEAHVCNIRTPISQLFSRESWRMAESSFETVLSEPGNVAARGRMLLASAYGGLAIAQSMLGAAHSAANPLTAHFRIIHGQAVGIMLPHVILYNSAEPPAATLYADLASAAGLARQTDEPEQAVAALLKRLSALLDAAELPQSLEAMRVPPNQISVLADEAAKQWTANFNPRKASALEFRGIYTAAFTPRAKGLNLNASRSVSESRK